MVSLKVNEGTLHHQTYNVISVYRKTIPHKAFMSGKLIIEKRIAGE